MLNKLILDVNDVILRPLDWERKASNIRLIFNMASIFLLGMFSSSLSLFSNYLSMKFLLTKQLVFVRSFVNMYVGSFEYIRVICFQFSIKLSSILSGILSGIL